MIKVKLNPLKQNMQLTLLKIPKKKKYKNDTLIFKMPNHPINPNFFLTNPYTR